jgi:hypothetical protein
MPCPDDRAASRPIVRRQKIQLIDDLQTLWSGDRRLLDVAILQVDCHDGSFPRVNRASGHFGSSFAWGAHASAVGVRSTEPLAAVGSEMVRSRRDLARQAGIAVRAHEDSGSVTEAGVRFIAGVEPALTDIGKAVEGLTAERRGLENPQWECQELWIRGLRTSNAWGPAEVPHGTSPSISSAFFYDAAFAHTMTRGLVPAVLGQVTVLSLIRVTGILRGPQYPITSTSFWLHSPLHAAAVQSRRITRMAFSAAPGGTAGPCAP